jgi:hypothetical protein
LAGWVARALDSLGTMPEAEPLRAALPALRHSAGLCQKCGRPTHGRDVLCSACLAQSAEPHTAADSIARTSSTRKRS